MIHKNGRILGASILAPMAGEIIQTWTLAIANRQKITSLATMIAPYPPMARPTNVPLAIF